jgi:hypothetical protein
MIINTIRAEDSEDGGDDHDLDQHEEDDDQEDQA